MNETLYFNGTILTMEFPSISQYPSVTTVPAVSFAAQRSNPYAPRTSAQAEPPQAVLVRDGLIAATGSLEQLKSQVHPGCQFRDLEGHTLMPAFIDSHSHFSAVANSLLQVSLEGAEDFQDIIRRIQEFIRKNQIPEGQWVIAQGYDHNLLSEKNHPRRQVLDQASARHPIILQHASGHVGVFNTLALRLLEITRDTPCPSGGVLEQINGQPSGYMEENAFIHFLQKAPALPSAQKLLNAFDRAQDIYASYGITTIQEGYFSSQLIPLYRSLTGQKLLRLDVVGYPDWKEIDQVLEAFPLSRRQYHRRLKINGCKMFLDGSPQGRTAWMRSPYADDQSYRGYPTMDDADVIQACRAALDRKVQILAHCNGDAAAAQYLRCYETAAGPDPENGPDIRPVMIHAQLLGPDQLPKVKALGMIPSFFIAHIFHWGDIHIRNFGLERASNISPAGSALRLGIPFTFHQDSPVIRPNMAETLWCAVCRHTRQGILLGADQRIPVELALAAVTANAAWQYGEEGEKGSITPGKRADLVILRQNPLKLPPEELKDLTVMETIKDGQSIWRKP